MELIFYIIEKSKNIYLTIILVFISLILTLLAHHEANKLPNPQDMLDGALILPLNWLMQAMWYATLIAFFLYIFRQVSYKLFNN